MTIQKFSRSPPRTRSRLPAPPSKPSAESAPTSHPAPASFAMPRYRCFKLQSDKFFWTFVIFFKVSLLRKSATRGDGGNCQRELRDICFVLEGWFLGWGQVTRRSATSNYSCCCCSNFAEVKWVPCLPFYKL